MKTMIMLVLGLGVALTSVTVNAQSGNDDFSAGRKITGSVYRPHTARTYQGHAINHAQVLRHYATTNATVPGDTAKEHATEVRKNLDKSFAELEKLDKDISKDKAAQALLAEIKAHHKKADAVCGTLETECLKQAADGKVVASCCTDMLKELEAAYVAHDKLLKHLGVPVSTKK